jgi:hypothetical protein
MLAAWRPRLIAVSNGMKANFNHVCRYRTAYFCRMKLIAQSLGNFDAGHGLHLLEEVNY